VDPSDIAKEVAPAITVVNTTFPSEQALGILPKRGIDIITSIAMFYDLEEPVKFASEIEGLLGEDGIWIFEMSYLPLMLLQNSFDTICHEHLEYYSLAVLETIAARAKLRIFRTDITDINGGSIRCYACRAENSKYGTDGDRKFMQRLRIREFEMMLDTDKPYVEFQARIDGLKKSLGEILSAIRARGEHIHVYGASTKGNVLLQWYNIGKSIVDCASDRNPEKAGSKTLGTEIPIVAEAESRARKPDYYLVLPWHFKREFLQRERDAIIQGTKMIFPLPTIEIVSRDNYAEACEAAEKESKGVTALLLGSD
jgi:NDP-4-keto-2,6-dideoxyhexose 3-C-methyltransferase